jgi:hypothetical protein
MTIAAYTGVWTGPSGHYVRFASDRKETGALMYYYVCSLNRIEVS